MVVLSESPTTPTGAYAASMVVILLRTLTRSGEEGMAAFVGGGGVGALLRLLPTLREDRALCLALYLLSDVTRRSAQALGQAVQAGGVPLVVACLRCVLSAPARLGEGGAGRVGQAGLSWGLAPVEAPACSQGEDCWEVADLFCWRGCLAEGGRPKAAGWVKGLHGGGEAAGGEELQVEARGLYMLAASHAGLQPSHQRAGSAGQLLTPSIPCCPCGPAGIHWASQPSLQHCSSTAGACWRRWASSSGAPAPWTACSACCADSTVPQQQPAPLPRSTSSRMAPLPGRCYLRCQPTRSPL